MTTMATITMREARTLYTAGNNAGAGYAPDEDSVDEAAEALNGDVILERSTSDDVALVLDGGELVAIGGDAMGRNAWAVTVLDARKIEALRTAAGQAGDLAQIAICDRADAGDRDAIIECARVMADAAGQS